MSDLPSRLYEPDSSRQCFWCGEPPMFVSWYCRRCIDLKEEAYKIASERGNLSRDEVLDVVREHMEKNGVKPISRNQQVSMEVAASMAIRKPG